MTTAQDDTQNPEVRSAIALYRALYLKEWQQKHETDSSVWMMMIGKVMAFRADAQLYHMSWVRFCEWCGNSGLSIALKYSGVDISPTAEYPYHEV